MVISSWAKRESADAKRWRNALISQLYREYWLSLSHSVWLCSASFPSPYLFVEFKHCTSVCGCVCARVCDMFQGMLSKITPEWWKCWVITLIDRFILPVLQTDYHYDHFRARLRVLFIRYSRSIKIDVVRIYGTVLPKVSVCDSWLDFDIVFAPRVSLTIIEYFRIVRIIVINVSFLVRVTIDWII